MSDIDIKALREKAEEEQAVTTYEEAVEKALEALRESASGCYFGHGRTDAELVLKAAGVPALIEENERLRAERDEFKRLFGECHPVHLDGVQRARVAESQRDAEKARGDAAEKVIADALNAGQHTGYSHHKEPVMRILAGYTPTQDTKENR